MRYQFTSQTLAAGLLTSAALVTAFPIADAEAGRYATYAAHAGNAANGIQSIGNLITMGTTAVNDVHDAFEKHHKREAEPVNWKKVGHTVGTIAKDVGKVGLTVAPLIMKREAEAEAEALAVAEAEAEADAYPEAGRFSTYAGHANNVANGVQAAGNVVTMVTSAVNAAHDAFSKHHKREALALAEAEADAEADADADANIYTTAIKDTFKIGEKVYNGVEGVKQARQQRQQQYKRDADADAYAYAYADADAEADAEADPSWQRGIQIADDVGGFFSSVGGAAGQGVSSANSFHALKHHKREAEADADADADAIAEAYYNMLA